MMTKRSAWWWTLTLVGSLAACSGSSDGDDTTPDAGSDASGDTDFADTGDEETTPDVAEPDASPDAAPDVPPDVAPDVAPDVEPDVTPDVESDIVPDTDVEEPLPLGPFACDAVVADGDVFGNENYVIWADGRVASADVTEPWGRYRYETDWDDEGRIVRERYESFYRMQEEGDEPTFEVDYWSEEIVTWLDAPPSEARRVVVRSGSGSDEEGTIDEFLYNAAGRMTSSETRRGDDLLYRTEYEPDWFGESFAIREDSDGDGTWNMEVEIVREDGRIVSAERTRSDDDATTRWEFTYEGDDTRWKTRWFVDTSGIGSTEFNERTWFGETRFEEIRRVEASAPIDLVRVIDVDPSTGIWTEIADLYPSSCVVLAQLYTANGEYRGSRTQSWTGLSGEECVTAWRDGVEPTTFDARIYGDFGQTLFEEKYADGAMFRIVTVYDEDGLVVSERTTNLDAEGNVTQENFVEAVFERDAGGRVTSWTFDQGEEERFRTWTYDEEGRILTMVLDGYRSSLGSSGSAREIEYTWEEGRVATLRFYWYALEDGRGEPDSERSMTYEAGFPYTLCSSDGEIPERD